MKNIVYSLLFLGTMALAGCAGEGGVTPSKDPFLEGWEITKTKINLDVNPRDLFFINPKAGFIAGYNGKIFKTIDSGKSWQRLHSGTTLHLFSVYFINENIGFVSGEAMNGCLDPDCNKGAVLLKTTDGGKTWIKELFKDYAGIYSLHFFNKSVGLAIIRTRMVPNSPYYHIAKTEDGGNSWVLIDLTIMSDAKIYCADGVVFISGRNQKIYESSDGGNNWKAISTPLPAWNDVGNLYFYNKNAGFMDGGSGMYKTTDGGLKWESVDFPFTYFGTFHFYNHAEGFNIVQVSAYEGGDFPTFKGSQSYQTFNGGETWTKSKLNDSFFIGLTCFPERDLGYGIGGSYFYTLKKK